jgi:hypothetical protein
MCAFLFVTKRDTYPFCIVLLYTISLTVLGFKKVKIIQLLTVTQKQWLSIYPVRNESRYFMGPQYLLRKIQRQRFLRRIVVVEWLTLLHRIGRSLVQIGPRRPAMLLEVIVVFLSPSRHMPT